MKRSVLVIGGIIVVAGIAVVLLCVSAKHRYMHSVGDICLYGLFLGNDTTVFASGYDEAKFQLVKPGMTKAAVLELLGEPLTRQSVAEGGSHEVWRYSKSRSNENFWFRTVIFRGGDQVTETQAKYFVD